MSIKLEQIENINVANINDVEVTAPVQTGEGLIFNAATGLWENQFIDTSLLTGNTLWVDAEYGDDENAELYDESKPFSTIIAALLQCTDGDLIHVRPGTYTGAITLKSNVNIWCDPGVEVTTASDFDNWVIGDNGSTVTNATWLVVCFTVHKETQL